MAGAQAAAGGALPVENGRTLWAGSLPPYIDESLLYNLFAPTGELVSARVMRDRQTGLSQGFAFLEFSSNAAAAGVLDSYDGKPIPGTNHVLRLNWAAFGLGRSPEGTDGAESHSLFVGDLALEVTDLLLQKHFQQYFSSVTSAKVITERTTGRSKGYGFVRFALAEERDKALGCMEGHLICNRPIRVNNATAKKYQGDGLFHPSDSDPSNTTAFVGNVSADVTEEDLSRVFRSCGEIVAIKLLRAKGCAFVTFAQRADAERAIKELHGHVIRNCSIRLCWGRRNAQMRGQQPLAALGAPLPLAAYQGGLLPGYGAGLLPGYGAAFRLPGHMLGAAGGGMPQAPVAHPILDAALLAAGLPTALVQQASLPGMQPSMLLPQLQPNQAAVPDATLQALAGLSLAPQSTA